jgi:NAD(P)-dependent dehydrogenase (short-subunit alcohol dehydrogenase family)
MDAQYKLNGKKALITGGGTGIGKGCARALLQAGANVTIVGPEEDVLQAAAEDLAGDATGGVKVDYMLCDITREDEVKAAVEFAAKGDNLDIAVANAGTGMPGPIMLLTADQWKSLCDINVVGTAMTIKYAGLVMKEHGGGSIVAISSIESRRTCHFMSPYTVTKAGVDMLVKCAAVEFGPFDIRVNGIRPGYIVTEATEMALNDELKKSCVQQTPSGRPGFPDDVARSVLYLASDLSEFVNGQVLGVCGGFSVHKGENYEHLSRMIYGDEAVDSCVKGSG